MEMDADIGKVMDAIRAVAPNTIVIVTADNGAWLDAYPDAGRHHSGVRKDLRLKEAGAFRESCGGRTTSRRAYSTMR